MQQKLIDTFTELLSEVSTLEKQLNSIYHKMGSKAHSAELSKCLHPEQTQLTDHLKRLQLIKTSLKLKTAKKTTLTFTKPKLQTPSAIQDLEIIQNILSYQHQKLAIYEMLHPLSEALAEPIVSEMIEQTITDHRNTNTWLRQIIQNVLAPTLTTAQT